MGTTRSGSRILNGRTLVTLASGDGSASVVFPCAFPSKPSVFLVPHQGDEAATLTVSASTTSGFTLNVEGSNIEDGDAYFEWVAHERT